MVEDYLSARPVGEGREKFLLEDALASARRNRHHSALVTADCCRVRIYLMENKLPTVAELVAPTPTTPKLSGPVEDHAIEQYIIDSGRFLEEARVTTDISERLFDYGFDDEELSIGMALQHAAMKAYCANHADCPPDRSAADAHLKTKIAEARDEFDGFRLVARAVFPTMSDRVSLRVMGDVPDDLQRFINMAHTAYTTASQESYAEKLSKRGYPADKLKSLHEFLDALTWLDAAHEAASEAADADAPAPDPTDGKENRDAAYNELKTFMKEIKGVARAAFRKDAEALAKLGLA